MHCASVAGALTWACQTCKLGEYTLTRMLATCFSGMCHRMCRLRARVGAGTTSERPVWGGAAGRQRVLAGASDIQWAAREGKLRPAAAATTANPQQLAWAALC